MLATNEKYKRMFDWGWYTGLLTGVICWHWIPQDPWWVAFTATIILGGLGGLFEAWLINRRLKKDREENVGQ